MTVHVATQERPRYFWRFDLFHRILHGCLITCFLGLAGTGLPMKFNRAPWAETFANLIGGFGAVIFFHKFFGLLLICLFLLHLGFVVRKAFLKNRPDILYGPNSMVPRPKDALDMLAHFRWFLGLGPKPKFDRWTYWEKFDYWAVFWGMGIIGGSGVVMWGSELFARIMPGWIFNITLVLHSEEALLALWFIFTIHFFNGHLRPNKFPMDPVIFTGRISEEEYEDERPIEYERMRRLGRLSALETEPPPLWLQNFSRVIAVVAVSTGLTLFALTVIAILA